VQDIAFCGLDCGLKIWDTWCRTNAIVSQATTSGSPS
jgi:hypothetical protein